MRPCPSVDPRLQCFAAHTVVTGIGIFGLAKIMPTSFLPEEDQRAFLIVVQSPDGASLQRTSDAVKEVERLVGAMPQVKDVFAILGYSLLDSAPSPMLPSWLSN